jgi:hypothetical protein
MGWDIFISHASEDKDEIARPLAQLLESEGLSVWLDEHELVLGDCLQKKLDEGLSQSKWGIVVLSPHFLRKTWPQTELNALVSREENGAKVILPVWHQVSHEDLLKWSPLLASRLGISTSEGLEAVCRAILRAVCPRKAGNKKEVLENDHPQEFLDIWSQLAAEWPCDATEQIDKLVGQKAGRYLLKELVGLGGTGVVFRAIHIPAGTTVALKLFYPIREHLSSLTKATERAVRGLAALRHRGIAKLFDFGYFSRKEEVTAYLACEFIKGKSLDKWSQAIKEDPDAPVRRLRAAIEIADTMKSAHACKYVGDLGFQETGVLHGDLKPANIVVRLSDEQPKIVDFMEPDLQRLLAGSDRNYSYWEKREDGSYWYDVPQTAAFGTPAYMPPEQAIDGIVLPTSDVYSLGMTFAELFWPPLWYRIDPLPWGSEENQASMNRSPADRKTQDSLIEKNIRLLIGEMTMDEPHERIQSMGIVLMRLRHIQRDTDEL